MTQLLDIFLNLDVHLESVITSYGPWTYALLFLIIFCETGLVFIPFLPGDSLLFAAGAIAGLGVLNPLTLILLLSIAAIIGDSVNYAIGAHIGPKVFRKESRFFKHEHLIRTEHFYEEHGGKTIILARFIPIIRTFAPFVAGVGAMTYSRFLTFNVTGGILWVTLFVGSGTLFGNLPVVQEYFEFVILGIIFISLLPVVRQCQKRKKEVRC
ncbi:DedA family protein [Candidatus Peregrinibacteria bacterium]|nr:DedA family protein [Candidatus Peregrinibacteria bacterium]